MSFLGRFSKRFRQDTSYINPPTWSQDTSRNKPPTFIPYLIQNNITDIDNASHLDDVSRKDPIANFATYGIAREVFGDGFMVVDEDGEEHAKNSAIQYEMRILKAIDVLELAYAYAYWGGHSVIYTGKNRYVPKTPEGGRLASLKAFPRTMYDIKKYDSVGRAVSVEVTVMLGEGDYATREKKIPLPADDFIWVVPDPLPNNPYEGRPVLEAVWDDLTYLRYTVHSMSWYDMKIGNGMFYVITNSGIPDTFVTRLNTSLEDHSNRRATVFDGQHVKEFGFMGPSAGATDFQEHIDAIMERIAAGLDIPIDAIKGATGGTNEAANTAEKASFKKIGDERVKAEETLLEIFGRSGFPTDGYWFKWNERYAHDEEQRAQIDEAHARTLAIRGGWLTINEIRAEEGLGPTEGGDRIMSDKPDFQIGVEGLHGQEKQEQTRNEEGAQV
jgi:hypothetical protein